MNIKKMTAPNKELLFNLIKKLESGEITFEKHGNEYFFYQKDSNIPVKIGEIKVAEVNYGGYEGADWNQEFKENFYQEKGLTKCWYKDCPNQIFKSGLTQGVVDPIVDYQAVNIQCKDKHKRYICVNCYASKISK